jgi:hypothetical protein
LLEISEVTEVTVFNAIKSGKDFYLYRSILQLGKPFIELFGASQPVFHAQMYPTGNILSIKNNFKDMSSPNSSRFDPFSSRFDSWPKTHVMNFARSAGFISWGFSWRLKTTLEQLEDVQSAINNIMLGQEVPQGGKTWKQADLDALQRRESILLKRHRAEQGGGLSVNVVRLSRE